MRTSAFLLLTGLALSACSEAAGPSEPVDLLELEAVLAFDAAGTSEAGQNLVGIHRLPRELQLTAAQEAEIRALLEAHRENTQADREALVRIHRAVEEAVKAGQPREEIARILAQAQEIRSRMVEAERALSAAILNVLTAEQRAWLEAHQPRPCNTRNSTALSEAQRNQIAALVAAYEENNKADLELIRSALERARQAQANGASREEIARILQSARDATARLQAAQAELARAIDAVLTPEQKASGCVRNTPLRNTR